MLEVRQQEVWDAIESCPSRRGVTAFEPIHGAECRAEERSRKGGGSGLAV